MKNYKLVIQFDGSRYNGWQKQKVGEATIQYKIENVLNKMTGEEISVIGCGRLDPGVHAENYIANFQSNCELSTSMMLNYLYEFLPEDIVVKSMEQVTDRFHARYNVKSKTYVYRINNNKYRDVFNRKYEFQTDEVLNLMEMEAVAKLIIGEHDFQSFTNLKPGTKSTIRTINYINIKEANKIIEIEINGNDFLLNMERIIVGTLLEVGSGKLSKVDVEKILLREKRIENDPIARAKGLTLKSVQY